LKEQDVLAKTGITRKLRQSGLNYSTLINFTGFGDDGEEGLKKASDYYRALDGSILQTGKNGYHVHCGSNLL
jgi:hypothetical protein